MTRQSSPADWSEHNQPSSSSYQFKFAVNITPNDYPHVADQVPPFPGDGPIIPEGDGVLTAPDGSILTPYSVLELSEKSATTQRRQRKRHQDRGGDYVPRPPNPFILFRCWYTAKVHKPGSHDSSEGSLSRLCGQEWANLGVSQRCIFEEAAKIEKVKHAERYPGYRYKPVHKKGKKAAAAAAAAAAIAAADANVTIASTSTTFSDLQDGEYRLPRPTHRKTMSQSAMRLFDLPQLPEPSQVDFAPVHPALRRHRRSSSVPLPGDMDMIDRSCQPIEIPPAPFLALAGQDLPTRRSSRAGSLLFSGFNFPRPSQVMQPWGQPDASLFNYAAMRNSIVGLGSAPFSPSTAERHQLPTFAPTQYNIPPSNHYYHSYHEEPSGVQWTNPNPFAPTDSSSSGNSPHPFASVPLESSGSSSSAPSPPADLEIAPFQQVPDHIIGAMSDPIVVSSGADESNPGVALPFDLNVFKTANEMDFTDMGRPRGLSVLGLETHHLINHRHFDGSAYSQALQTEGLVGEIPSHEDVLEQYMQSSNPANINA